MKLIHRKEFKIGFLSKQGNDNGRYSLCHRATGGDNIHYDNSQVSEK